MNQKWASSPSTRSAKTGSPLAPYKPGTGPASALERMCDELVGRAWDTVD